MTKEAIEKISGPCVILAGAGTGKTYTIVEKVRYLIANKIYAPEKIVCITFSNEAANNLLTRIQKVVNLEPGKEPVIRTFHGFSADLLRKHGEKIGLNKDFNILDTDEAKIVLHRNFKINSYNCHKYVSSIGAAKDLGIKIEDLKSCLQKKIERFKGIDLENELEQLQLEFQIIYMHKDREKKRDISERIKKISDIIELKKFICAWDGYEKIKILKNYQDYSDLNKNALELLQKFPEIADEYDYTVIDEFQDTNKLQLDFLAALARDENITVVGDLNQSIYRFRGAYKENFALFKQYFNVQKEDIFTLHKSRRSPNKVLRNAHCLILNNYKDKSDCFMVENHEAKEGDFIEAYELRNAKEEARKIVELVERDVQAGVPLEEVCVMFRTHQQGRVIRRALEMKGIKYCSVSKDSLLKQKSIKRVIDYLVIVDKIARKERGGEQAWWDLMYHSNFFGNDLIKLGKYIKQNRENECISNLLLEKLPGLELSDDGKITAKILVEKIKLLGESTAKDVSEILQIIYAVCGYNNEALTNEEKERAMNLAKFFDLAKTQSALYAPDLSSFLHYLEILENLGIEVDAAELEENGVRLMTLHATKGLEYHTVVITNLVQKRFPLERYWSNSLIPIELYPEFAGLEMNEDELEAHVKEYERENQILDERRLCYVAFTRAKEKLILTYAQEYAGKKHFPSQFLNEINYRKNPDIKFVSDLSEKSIEAEMELKIAPASELNYLIRTDSFNNLLQNGNEAVPRDVNSIVFSPSQLLAFAECQKQYEYQYVYNMPEKKTGSWEAMRLGSFVHEVLEEGVNKNIHELQGFIDIAREMHLKEGWESVEFEEALHLIKVFFERNKNKYNEQSQTECLLNAKIGGYKFIGFADRIDFHPEGVEIVDYKTGKSFIPPKHREWQMGYYALAAVNLGYGKVHKITLEMLKQEKPLEFEVDNDGNAYSSVGDMFFNIYQVESELVEAAEKIIQAHKHGFKPCPIEKNCEFCSEYVYGN